MTVFDFVPESDHERVAARMADAFASGSAHIEAPLLRKDGSTIPYEFVGSLVEHPDGSVQIVGVGRDIAERRRRKEVLERQNDLFTKAQDIASVGAWEYNRRADETVLSKEACRIFGIEPGTTTTPAETHELFHPDDQSTVRSAFRRALENGEPYDLELRLTPRDGTQRWVHTRGEPQMENGEVVRLRGTIQDVTERVQRRQELEDAKETAEEADRIKSALLSNMNHEFRTPLTSIISFSKLIRESPELAEDFADRILGGGRRLLHTLNTVMDFAELEAHSEASAPTHVDVGGLARSVISKLSHLVDRKELSVQVCEPDGAVAGILDEHLVERVLVHLVNNAVKFTENGEVSVTVCTEGETVVLRVTDTGIGIDPAFLPRVYDQFAQASSGDDRTHEGNGLGLTIVNRMVARMDGTVSIDSTPGEGTEVTVRLPTRRGPGQAPPSSGKPEP